jgi:predicted XRE-type DNA-binding protein
MAVRDAERFRDPIPALKRQLADELVLLLDGYERHLAGSYLGVEGARISDLRRGDLRRFSVQRLIRMLARIGRRTTLSVTPTNEVTQFLKPGERAVRVAAPVFRIVSLDDPPAPSLPQPGTPSLQEEGGNFASSTREYGASTAGTPDSEG